jgi:hypothetical protein
LSNIKLKYKKTAEAHPAPRSVSAKPKGSKDPGGKKKRSKPVLLLQKSGRSVLRVVRSKKFLATIVILILMGVAFYAGMKVQSILNLRTSNVHTPNVRPDLPSHVSGNSTDNTDQEGIPLNTSSSGNGTSTSSSNRVLFSGNITTIDASQMVVKNSSGDTKTFVFSSKTIVMSMAGKAITASGLKVGNKVAIYASKASDGSLNLERVRIEAAD